MTAARTARRRVACWCRGPTSAATSSPRDCATRGALVTDVVAYRTVLEDAQQDGDPDIYRMLLDGRIDVVTFTSPSAVRNFAAIYGAEQTVDLLEEHRGGRHRPGDGGCGARSSAFDVTVQPAVSTIPALVDAIAAHYAVTDEARRRT